MMRLVSNHSAAMNMGAVVFVIMAIAMLLPGTSSAAPIAKISASRTSGPAPLAVFFDATDTTDTNSVVEPFRELGYRFSFGDSTSGTWAYSGKSKNEQIGAPLAAHVFEIPGTYTVQVTAKDAAGATSNASITITVQSADSIYAGARTVCLSKTSDFTSCPAGAEQVGNAASWPSFQSGYRYLLHSGQDFNSLGALSFGSGGSGLVDSQLGSFGTGSKPTVGRITVQSGSTPVSTWNKRNVVMNLDAVNITQSIGGMDLLVFRNTINRGGMIEIASAFDYWAALSATGFQNPENIFVVENQIDRNYLQDGGNPNGITGNALRFAIMGNSVDRTWEHNVRVWQASKAIIAHNTLTGRCGESIRHAFKLHAGGLNSVSTSLPPGTDNTQRSSQIAVADNLLGSSSSNINWITAFAPQNDQYAEGIEYLISEDNQFRHGTNHYLDIAWAGRQLTSRGNNNATESKTASVDFGHTGALPADWKGPYFAGQTSMKLRFSGNDVRPLPPTSVHVN